MAMGPKFMTPLYFDCNGTLEVCGPTNFGPNDAQLVITELLIKQNDQTVPAPVPIIADAPATEWEVDIPGAKGRLAVGPATGFAVGRMVKTNGPDDAVSWPGALELKDGCAIVTDIAPDAVEAWMTYRTGGATAA
jgi:hypothetical protein